MQLEKGLIIKIRTAKIIESNTIQHRRKKYTKCIYKNPNAFNLVFNKSANHVGLP